MTDENTTKVRVSETGLAEIVEKLSAEFDHRVIDRHRLGAEKYGPFSFFNKDMFEEACQEVLDLANYARYSYIKLRLTQLQIAEEYTEFMQWRERKESEYTPDGGNAPQVNTRPMIPSMDLPPTGFRGHGFAPNGE